MKSILILSPSVISNDPRVARHAEVAVSFGQVTTCGFGDLGLPDCRHLKIPPNARYLSRNIINLILIQFGLHKFAARCTQYYREVKSIIDPMDYDIIIVNDVHALQIAVDLFPSDAIWADMHEYAPLESEHDWRWRVAYRRHVGFLCKSSLSDVRFVTSVGKVICETYQKDLGRPVLLLRNSSEYRTRERWPLDDSERQKNLVHVGVAIRARQLENMIYAAQACKEVHLTLYILPTDKKYFDEIVKICNEIPNVKIEQPIPLKDIVSKISSFDAGVVTIPPTSFNYANGLPNKLFQYIQARLPIITGPIPEVVAIVKECGIGIVTTDFSPVSIAKGFRDFCNADLMKFALNLENAAIEYSLNKENGIRREILQELLVQRDGPYSAGDDQ
jgi:glycosyltransferase involved in cell wall biosynthesis